MFKKIVLFLKINSAFRRVVIAVSLCLIALVFAGAIYGNFGTLLAKTTPLPINLHSAKQANYSQDPAYMQIPPMQLQLIIDAIWDQNPDTQNLSLRLTQAEQIYFSDVPSITPQPPTNIPPPLTGTPLPEQTTTPSLEISPSPTNPSPTDTIIPGGPTATNSFIPDTATQPPLTHTATQPPPTHTATQPPPTHTATQQHPTNTVVSPCDSISIRNFSTNLKRTTWNIINNSPSAITISHIILSWPSGNDSLDKIFLGTGKIWDQTAPPPSVVITSGWTGSSRDIGGSTTQSLKLTFLSKALTSGYNLSVRFTNGCSVSSSD
jgi:hypothetical protein